VGHVIARATHITRAVRVAIEQRTLCAARVVAVAECGRRRRVQTHLVRHGTVAIKKRAIDDRIGQHVAVCQMHGQRHTRNVAQLRRLRVVHAHKVANGERARVVVRRTLAVALPCIQVA